MFIIFAQTTMSSKLSKCALSHPTSRQHAEAFLRVASLDDLQGHRVVGPQCRKPLLQRLAVVATVNPDQPQSVERIFDRFKYSTRPLSILCVCGVNDNHKQQAKRVNQNVSLAPSHALAAIETRFGAACFGRLHALAIKEGCRGGRVSPFSYANLLAQVIVSALPGSIQAKLPKIMIDS